MSSDYIVKDEDESGDPIEYKIKNSPSKICLCLGESWDFDQESDFEDCNEVTWATDDPVSLVIGYIRDDIYESTRKALADTKAQLEALEDAIAKGEMINLGLSNRFKEEQIEIRIPYGEEEFYVVEQHIANSRARKQNGI